MKEKLVQELRWDPLLGEWVMVSNLREHRPWRPSKECPFCPGAPETGYGWKTLVLENKFPMLVEEPPEPTRHSFYGTAPARGKCLVLVETPTHDLDDISDLGVDDIARVLGDIASLTERYREEKWAIYLLYFRNKGEEIGVSLTHPHSQIYVTPFIPTKVLRELENARRYYKRYKKCLFCSILEAEERDGSRIIGRNRDWTAFIPFFAHWPFEVHIYPHHHIQLISDVSNSSLRGLAELLKKMLCGLKNLFERPMPYMMVLHQAPLKGRYPYYHLHLEIYGVYRVSGRLKYAAGMETGGGNFTYDSTPEKAAEMLKTSISTHCM
ncbi:MAG: galactose-1-phosphate uridylyltransferase [Pyrodictiaceae archaeon]